MYQPQTSQPDYTWLIVIGLCILLFFSSVGIGIWKKDEISDFLGVSESSESPSATPSPSPVNCEIDWTNASWKPCDANICVAKGNEYPMYHYRTGTITQTSQHGGRACDSLLQFKTVGSGTASSDPASSEPASSDPASSEPASSDPASSEPASSDPASSVPASSDPASSDPASSDPASSQSASNPTEGTQTNEESYPNMMEIANLSEFSIDVDGLTKTNNIMNNCIRECSANTDCIMVTLSNPVCKFVHKSHLQDIANITFERVNDVLYIPTTQTNDLNIRHFTKIDSNIDTHSNDYGTFVRFDNDWMPSVPASSDTHLFSGGRLFVADENGISLYPTTYPLDPTVIQNNTVWTRTPMNPDYFTLQHGNLCMTANGSAVGIESNCDLNDRKTHWKLYEFNARSYVYGNMNIYTQRNTLQNRHFDTQCIIVENTTPEFKECNEFNQQVHFNKVLSSKNWASITNFFTENE
jgi:hypothetical protein